MVSLKQLLIAAPLFLQGISAVPTSGADLSARDETDVQSRDFSDFNLQARDFDAAVAPEERDEATIGLRFDEEDGLQARKDDNKKKDPKKDPKKKKCNKTKPKRGIELARRTLSQAQKGASGWVIDENDYVNAARLKTGDVITVPNLTGCSALYLWTSENTASVFHILCGKESGDGKAAAEIVKKLGDQAYIKPVSATVKSLKIEDANKVKDAVLGVFPGLPIETSTYKDYGIANCKAAILTTTAGTKSISEKEGDMVSRQPQ